MKLIDTSPIRLLAPFVECYWYVQADPGETSPFGDAIVPNGTSNLIFNLSDDPHFEFSSQHVGRRQTLVTRWLSGIRGSPRCVAATGQTRVVGIRFKPAGMLPFAKTPPGELTSQTVDPDDVWGQNCAELHDRLFGAPTTSAMFDLLEKWLLARSCFAEIPREAGLFRALKCLRRAHGQVSIAHLATVADLSPRQLRRRFERTIGLTPKTARPSSPISSTDPEHRRFQTERRLGISGCRKRVL